MVIEKLYHRESRYLKLVIISLTTIFFISVYSICNYFYPEINPENDRLWWNMKCDLYLFLVTVWIGIAAMPKCTDRKIARINRIITAIGIGYGIANFIDRRFLHDREFGWNDLGIVIVIVLVSQIDLKKIKDQAINNI